MLTKAPQKCFLCFLFLVLVLWQPLQAEKSYQVFYKNLKGKTTALNVKASDTIDKVRAKISGMENLPESEIRLIFMGSQLQDGRTLKDYNMKQDSTVSVVQLAIFTLFGFHFMFFILCFSFYVFILWFHFMFLFLLSPKHQLNRH